MKKSYGLKGGFFFSFLVIGFFIYNPCSLYFLNDDMTHLPLSSKGIFFQRHSFRPIHDLLLIIEYKLWGLNAVGYHIVEWLIHIVCSVLVYVFAVDLLARFSRLKDKELTVSSLLSAALFSVYAFHSESVLWLLGSGASLATLFFLLSAIAYMRRNDGVVYFILSLLFFQIGLFTYEAIWAAPFFIALLSWSSVKNKLIDWKKEWVYPSVYFFSFLINILLRKIILGELGGSYGDDKLFDFSIKRLVYNGVCLFARSFVPPSHSTAFFMGGVAVLVVVLFSVIRKVVALKAVDSVFNILFFTFLLSLLPVISLGISTHSRESERFLYLPSVFLCVLIVYALTIILSTKKMLACVFILMLYNIYFTYANARDYKVAGSISKVFYNQFERRNGDDSIIIRKFPQQFNGLPLFRSGFKEGLAWFYKIDTSRIIIPNDEEMKVSFAYEKAITNSDFNFYFRENINSSQHELTLVFDTTYFSIVDVSKK